MRRGRELALALAGAAGLAGLTLAGDLHPAGLAVAVALLVVAPLLRGWLQAVSWPLVTIPVLAVGASLAILDVLAPTVALGAVLAYLLVQRVAARRGPRDDILALGVTLLMLGRAATATDSPSFLALALAWAGALPVVLAGGHLERLPARLGRHASGGWALPTLGVLVLAPLLFLALPRLGEPRTPGGDEPVALTGFGAEVALGEIGELFASDEPVFKAWVETAAGARVPGPMYFRGVVLDVFDGTRWYRSAAPVPAQTLPEGVVRAPSGGFRVLVQREPVAEGVLFTMGRVEVMGASFPARRDALGAWFGPPGRVEYAVQALPPLRPGELPDLTDEPPLALPVELEPWTRLPAGLDPRVWELAWSIAPHDTDPAVVVDALEAHLRREYAYSRSVPDLGPDPLVAFLFERGEGHCEYFASALAVLARARGVPARVVNGFVGGERNELGGYWLFRAYHAHSWVEVYLPGVGWVTADATPGPEAPPPTSTAVERSVQALETAWYGGLLDYDLAVQTGVVLTASRRVEGLTTGGSGRQVPWTGLGLLLLGLGAAGLLGVPVSRGLRRALGPRRRSRSRVGRVHDRVRRRLAGRGLVPPEPLPPLAAARWLQGHLAEGAGEALVALVWLVYRVEHRGEDEGPLLAEARVLARRAVR